MTRPSVAIVGASADRSKFGNKSVRAHRLAGYAVYPVNPKGGQIEELVVYPSVAEVPVARLNRVSLYVPPQVGIALLEQIVDKGCDELFLNPDSASPALIEKARRLGLEVIEGCSIVDVGHSPAEFPDV
jgi:uncharacterized protein